MKEDKVFISYRRDSKGNSFARAIQKSLEMHGYDVFLDVDRIGAGLWESQLLHEVPKRTHFLVLITSDALRRCDEEGDWLVREFNLALTHNRNIVPIFEESIDMQSEHSECPSCMAELFKYQGLKIRHETFDADILRLIERYFGKSSPGPCNSKKPKPWHIPFRRNPCFSGREVQIGELSKALQNPKGVRTYAIVGISGVGKSQLTLEFTCRFTNCFSGVWWFQAENEASLVRDFMVFASRNDIPFDMDYPQDGILQVRNWIDNQETSWLLIFDSVSDSVNLENYLPQFGNHLVLITSWNECWRSIAQHTLLLDSLGPDDACSLLHNRTGLELDQYAGILAEELGYLPLALEQCAGYIEATGISFQEYVTLFVHHSKELLSFRPRLSCHEKTIYSTWHLAFTKLSEENPEALSLLSLYSYLAPSDIPRTLLPNPAYTVPEGLKLLASDKFEHNRAIASLKRFSLIQTNGDVISIHRLVQLVVRDSIAESFACPAIVALRMISDEFVSVLANIYLVRERLLMLIPHAQYVIKFANSSVSDDFITFDMNRDPEWMSHFHIAPPKLVYIGLSDSSMISTNPVLTGPSLIATLLYRVGCILCEENDLGRSAEQFKIALDLISSGINWYPGLEALCYVRLAEISYLQGRYRDAIDYAVRGKRIFEENDVDYYEGHPELTICKAIIKASEIKLMYLALAGTVMELQSLQHLQPYGTPKGLLILEIVDGRNHPLSILAHLRLSILEK